MAPPRKPTRPAKRAPTPTSSNPVVVTRRAAFATTSPEDAFRHFRPLAEKVPTDDLSLFTGNALVMKANIDIALAAAEPHLATVAARLPSAPLRDIFELPSLALALDHACHRVPSAPLSAGEIDAMLAEGRPWRQLVLTYLEVVSSPLLKLVPAERVRAIREGSGPLDTARDFVALPAVFREYEESLAGRHPFTPEQLARLGELGAALVAAIRPKGAPAPREGRAPEAILRDQFAWLVEERYDHLAVALSVAVGHRKAAALLPALRSTVVSAPKPDATPVTPPAGPANPQ